MSHFKKHPTLARSISNYARMGIIIEILTLNTTEAKVKVIQKTALNGYLLNQQQLVERVRKVFAPTGLKVNVYHEVWALDIAQITLEWIEEQRKEFGLKRKDIMQQLNIDKSSLSLLLSGKTQLSKRTKACFYYYFLCYALNRDFHSQTG